MASDADKLKDAKKTWRYLRLAIVVMVVGLGVSVARELVRQDGCLQPSISGYFHTPVRGFFVGTLVAVGVCLVSLRGNTGFEDVLLNLAGAFSMVVALVPTGAGDPPECGAVAAEQAAREHIDNNMVALLVVAGLALALVLYLILRHSDGTPFEMVGWSVAVVVYVVATVLFVAKDAWFDRNAHTGAATAMFVCIFAVVVVDAVDYRATPGSSARNRYAVVAGLMVLAAVVVGLARVLGKWHYAVFWIEALMIGLFAVFWVIQTFELWNDGLRDT